jgi:aspartate aminotransferase
MQFSDFIGRVNEPQTILMAKKTRELKALGIQITDLTLGEPDFATPKHIIEAAITAMHEGYTKYPPVAGYAELRQAVCQKLATDNHLHYLPEEIMVSTGAKQALANVILSIINPGDEAIIPTPYWVTYASLVALGQGACTFIPCNVDDNFKLSAEKLEAAITPKSRLFIFSSPCNPSGAVYSREELEALKNVFVKYPDIYIISDEIYEYINFTGRHQSIAQFPELKDRVIIINGFSKGFAMTGWRLGYMAANREIVSACEKLQSQFTSGANSIAQRAAITALVADKAPSMAMTAAFKERKEYFISALNNIEGIKINNPEGAFYAFPDISAFFGKSDGHTHIQNADDFTMYLLNTGHVAGVSGAAFGTESGIRFSFATDLDTLKEAVEKIKTALSRLH